MMPYTRYLKKGKRCLDVRDMGIGSEIEKKKCPKKITLKLNGREWKFATSVHVQNVMKNVMKNLIFCVGLQTETRTYDVRCMPYLLVADYVQQTVYSNSSLIGT